MFITSPEVFAEWFNIKVRGAYRKITADDVSLMTECKLVGIYGFYGRQDLETVRGILQYEQLREKQPIQQDEEKKLPTCKLCKQPLPPKPGGKPGKHKEYCSDCEPFRNKERQKHFRHHHEVRKYLLRRLI